jgi:hypothetical protein
VCGRAHSRGVRAQGGYRDCACRGSEQQGRGGRGSPCQARWGRAQTESRGASCGGAGREGTGIREGAGADDVIAGGILRLWLIIGLGQAVARGEWRVVCGVRHAGRQGVITVKKHIHSAPVPVALSSYMTFGRRNPESWDSVETDFRRHCQCLQWSSGICDGSFQANCRWLSRLKPVDPCQP